MSATRIDAGALVRSAGRGVLFSTAAVTAAAVGVLLVEAVAALTRRYARPAIGPGMRATFGDRAGPLVRMVMLGDSMAAGVGVDRVQDTAGGQLAARLADDGQRVELSSVAVSGSRSADLDTQVARALLHRPPDLAVILVGGQDVVHGVGPARAATELAAAVTQLRAAGAVVVVGGCPELGACRAIGRPLRELVGLLGRRLARAQLAATRSADAIPVDLATAAGAAFRADVGLLAADGFHPSAAGYRLWVDALYPAVAPALRR